MRARAEPFRLTQRTHDVRHLLVTTLLMVAACSGDASVLTNQAVLPEDPCALVTVKEVEAATGSTVVRSGLISDEQQRLPELQNPCEYVTDGRHGSILVSVDTDGALVFARVRGEDPINTEPIEGVGDEAFAHGRSSLLVRVGDGYFEIGTQHGAGWPGVLDLTELARAALE
jgi:hypothetical protein